jgi:predicted metal-dependent phosphotriesterase family hydrolase
MSDPKLMAQELMTAKNEGVACIVDGGHPDSGRDIAFLREAARLSGMPVVAGGGFYAQPWYPERDLDDEREPDRRCAPQAGG